MKIAFIGTYPPRECGIGTFTHDLFNSVISDNNRQENVNTGFVVALNDFSNVYDYPQEVKLTIRQEHQEDYIQAVKFINHSGAEVCILEHEFGIFGGQSGVYILPLLHRLEIPLIVTLHTILKSPSYNEKAVLQEICKMAGKIVVMSHKAIDFLVHIYDVPEERIVLIDHGVPDIKFSAEKSKQEFKLEHKHVLTTFGFIGRNKGIETVIKALPGVIEKYPEVFYMILGKTHPNVLRHSGEEYRIYLMRLVKTLGLEKNVFFLNEFLDVNDLFKYLSATDIYITPYLHEAQITSGTLAYAVGVGAAVISTPYWHAAELLANGRGKLFSFGNSEELSSLLTELLDNPVELKKLKEKAGEYGRNITWPKTGEKYIAVAKEAVMQGTLEMEKKDTIMDLLILPPFSLTHINRLTDDTGIIQHAKFGIPNLKEGYCLDDNARALLMVLMAYRQIKDLRSLELSPVYLSYIHYMQNKDGTFRNFLSFSRNYLDEIGSEDSFGRTIWALGYLLGNAPNDAYYQTGRLMFFNAAPNFEKLKSIRSIANTMIGICYYLRTSPGDDSMTERLRNMAHKLIQQFDANQSPDWQWFESLLAYDNGMLPLALLHSAEILNEDKVLEVAMKSMQFLTAHTLKENYLSVIGNEKWYKKDGERSVFAQQPVDAMAMVLMYHQAFHVTKDKEFLNKLYTSFLWFLGENDLRLSLYDFETQGCCDGFEVYGVNRNQGAESSLAYLISHLTVLQAYEEFHKVGS
ncbi:glycosyltransferase family 4 protein [Marinilabilia salmonicolor]|jgi:glycosyltransferase involved in cell wall biosynthesis|uniref:Glycosyltransferase involved in cell wall biosynthesis n=1 Tax=Marinilabilia salmonicolor TaxID=989 RepID=A0A2T0XH78_9BACT|nr:glycosyltransferase family 4 protein [Marinilabilia salmonicolor]PRY98272.1 glycosyltransferase involved in cell wall biosynthesis [Marinilabilia salmonicolor]RCW33846.1 glycosyltransferase involved in cell wall biosynthesis [Marinilabilia salmonicolor]